MANLDPGHGPLPGHGLFGTRLYERQASMHVHAAPLAQAAGWQAHAYALAHISGAARVRQPATHAAQFPSFPSSGAAKLYITKAYSQFIFLNI